MTRELALRKWAHAFEHLRKNLGDPAIDAVCCTDGGVVTCHRLRVVWRAPRLLASHNQRRLKARMRLQPDELPAYQAVAGARIIQHSGWFGFDYIGKAARLVYQQRALSGLDIRHTGQKGLPLLRPLPGDYLNQVDTQLTPYGVHIDSRFIGLRNSPDVLTDHVTLVNDVLSVGDGDGDDVRFESGNDALIELRTRGGRSVLIPAGHRLYGPLLEALKNSNAVG